MGTGELSIGTKVRRYIARKGWAVITGDLEKDYDLLRYVNPSDGVGWLDIEGMSYGPVMRGEIYKRKNFLGKTSEYGEVVRKETPFDVVYLEGSSQGDASDKRFAGFMQIEMLGNRMGETVVKYKDKEGLREYRVISVSEIMLEDYNIEPIRTTEDLIESIQRKAIKKVKRKHKGGILILQRVTQFDVTIIMLEEEVRDEKRK